MAAIRHETRGAAREPDGGTPGRTYLLRLCRAEGRNWMDSNDRAKALSQNLRGDKRPPNPQAVLRSHE
jgi:hypothetical protein